MTIPSYFTTSPINGGTPLTINAPPVGGIVYDFVGLNDQRVTAYFGASSLPEFDSSGTQTTVLNSSILPSRAINALGGGIKQLSIRLTINDGDTAPRNPGDATNVNQEYNTAFLMFNGVSQAVNLSSIYTYSHTGSGDVSNPSATPPNQGFPNEELSTGWGLITDETELTAIYNSIVSNGNTIDLKWQSVNSTIGNNHIDFQSGLDQDIIDAPSIAPNVIPTFNLKLGSDTGISDSDGITAAPTPDFSGKSVPNDILNVYRDAPGGRILLGTTTADATTGAWSFTPSTALPEGSYDIIVDVVDNSNAVISSASVPVTIDLTAPTKPLITSISDDSGIAGDGITNDSTLTFTGTAEANSAVQFFEGTTLLGTATASDTGILSFTPSTPFSVGNHTITAKATDIAGNISSASNDFLVTIDASIATPAVPDLIDASDSGISTDNITNNTTPTFSGTTEANSVVQIFDGNTQLGTANADASGIWSFTTPLNAGSHSITTTAIDPAGNVSALSPALTVTINTTKPRTPAAAPDLTAASDTGVSNVDNLTGDNTPDFVGQLTGAEANYIVTLYDGSTKIGAGVVAANGSWSVNASGLINGSHNISYTVTDLVGNESLASPGLDVMVNAIIPTAPAAAPDLINASDTGPSKTDDITADTTPTFSGTGTVGQLVKLYADSLQVGEGVVDTEGSWSVTASALSYGGHSITSTFADANTGNESDKSPALSITLDTKALVQLGTPQLDLGGSTGGNGSTSGGLTNDNTPTLKGTGEPGSTIELLTGDRVIGTATVKGDGTWSFTPTAALADGTYPVKVRSGGLVSPETPLIIDTKPATVAILDLDQKVRDSSVNAITLQFNEAVKNVKLSDLTLTLEGQPVSLQGATLTTTDSKIWTIGNVPGLTTKSSGEYQITLKGGNATDLAGNILTTGASNSWLTGYTADTMPAISFKGGKTGVKLSDTGNRGTLQGGSNRDILKGLGGNDRIFGRAGNDRLVGGSGNDQLVGGSRKDSLNGGSGNDRLRGGTGNDVLKGGGGKDRLLGGAGDDVLVGGTGNDLLRGGGGKDTFVYTSLKDGNDRIAKFDSAKDLIDLRGIFKASQFSGDNRFAQYRNSVQLTQVGSSTEVQVDADGKGSGKTFTTLMTLQNVSVSAIGSTNFVIG